MNKIVIEKGAGFIIAKVVRTFHERGFGFARFQKQEIYFHFKNGRGIIAGHPHPEFIDQAAAPVKQGEFIVLYPEKGQQGLAASVWGSLQELDQAEKAIESRGKEKPAPKCPPMSGCKAPQSQIDRRPKVDRSFTSLEGLVAAQGLTI